MTVNDNLTSLYSSHIALSLRYVIAKSRGYAPSKEESERVIKRSFSNLTFPTERLFND